MVQTFKDFRISIIGAGRLGSALARYLYQLGNPPFSMISGNTAWLEQLAVDSHPVSFSNRIDNLHRESNLIILAIPDNQIEPVARQLAQILFFDWQNTVVLHTSGAHDAKVLSPVARLGAKTGACHPVQTFPTRNEPSSRFSHIYWGIDGNAGVLPAIREFVTALRGNPVLIPPTARPMYHLACVMASNYVVTLTALAGDVLAACGVQREDGQKMLLPLIEGTISGLESMNPVVALTGPVSRGDSKTIALHLAELRVQVPHLVPVYIELARQTLRLAVRKESLTPAQVQAMNLILDQAANQPSSDSTPG